MKIDCHVHIVGNGQHGSGCRLRFKGLNHALSIFMLRDLGLRRADVQGDLESRYIERLLAFVKNSSLDRIVILAHEQTYSDTGSILPQFESIYVPNDFVLKLAQNHQEFLPAVSIHPARPDAIDELERGKALGAVMMKCLPNCQNIDCRLPKYRPFWRKMADLKLPLLAHTGGELSLPVASRALEDPAILRAPLEEGVTVIAAHLGTNALPFAPNYLPTFVRMCRSYKNLFGDTSALNTPFRVTAYRHPDLQEVADRLIHGSDLPVPTSPRWAALRGLLDAQTTSRLTELRNPLERDVQTKLALKIPSESLTRLSKILGLRDGIVGS